MVPVMPVRSLGRSILPRLAQMGASTNAGASPQAANACCRRSQCPAFTRPDRRALVPRAGDADRRNCRLTSRPLLERPAPGWPPSCVRERSRPLAPALRTGVVSRGTSSDEGRGSRSSGLETSYQSRRESRPRSGRARPGSFRSPGRSFELPYRAVKRKKIDHKRPKAGLSRRTSPRRPCAR